MSEQHATCELCGEPMPPGEEMFSYHGYSGPCPKPPLQTGRPAEAVAVRADQGGTVTQSFYLALSDAAATVQHHAVFNAQDPLERHRLLALANTLRAESRVQSKITQAPQPAEPRDPTRAPARRRHRHRLRASDAFVGIGSDRPGD